MPIIELTIGPLKAGKKAELIEELTKTAATSTKIPPDAFIVVLKEMADENIGVGGKPLDRVKKERLQAVPTTAAETSPETRRDENEF